jgi:hypothetical protein
MFRKTFSWASQVPPLGVAYVKAFDGTTVLIAEHVKDVAVGFTKDDVGFPGCVA